MPVLELKSREELDTYLGPDEGVVEDSLYELVDVVNFQEWDKFDKLQLSFDPYDRLFLLVHPDTKRLYLGDVNLGGHLPRARIVEISRSDLIERPNYIKSWYLSHSEKFWR